MDLLLDVIVGDVFILFMNSVCTSLSSSSSLYSFSTTSAQSEALFCNLSSSLVSADRVAATERVQTDKGDYSEQS